MKLGRLFLAFAIITSTFGFSQDDTDPDLECKRMKLFAGKKLDINDFKNAAMYYLKAEEMCGEYDSDDYNKRLIPTLRNVINEEQDPALNALYVDTILAVMDRAEAKGKYDASNDLARASYIAQQAHGDRKKADKLFVKGLAAGGNSVHEAYVTLYYYNLYMLYAEAKDAERPAAKKELISKYFSLSDLINKAKMSAATQDALNQYFNAAVQSCDDILPDLKGFIAALPQEKEAKRLTVKNFITLLESKGCTESKEYGQLIDTLILIDPTDYDAVIGKAKRLESQKKYSEAIGVYRDAKAITKDPAQNEEIEYAILRCTYGSGNIMSSYNMAMGMSGKYRGEALAIAAQAVVRNKDNCGASTVERKCSYYYAVELLEKARAAGANVGSLISSYKANYPTQGELFDAGMTKGQSYTISCYNVTVTIQ